MILHTLKHMVTFIAELTEASPHYNKTSESIENDRTKDGQTKFGQDQQRKGP